MHADRVLYTQTWSEQGGYWGTREILSPDLPRKLIYTGDHAFYAITKTTIVEMMEHYKQEYGLKNFVFRLPNVYLYHPDKYYYVDCVRKPIAYRYMIDRASKGEPIEMWGNPDAFKDVLYIKDLCQMMYKALFAEVNGGTYNAGTGIRTTLREQIEGIIQVFSPMNNKSEIIDKPDGVGFTSFVMDIENARKDLEYEPQFTYLKYLEDYKEEQRLKRFDELWIKNEKLAIIGASYLQEPLIEKAKNMGIETHVFAWKTGDVGEKSADFFYPISIVEKDEILKSAEKLVWMEFAALPVILRQLR